MKTDLPNRLYFNYKVSRHLQKIYLLKSKKSPQLRFRSHMKTSNQTIRRSYISYSLGSVSSKSTLYPCVVSPLFSDSSVFKSWNKYATSKKYEEKNITQGVDPMLRPTLIFVLLYCLWVFFINLKLELLTQFPASNE